MKRRSVSFSSVNTKVVSLQGGLNEEVASLELKGGELLAGLNYAMREGTYGGYTSVSGYEVYDGQEKPSSVPATDEDHAAQDAARALIGEVPGEGNVLGLYVFQGKVYAFRNKVGGATAGMFVESPTGWVEIDTVTSGALEPSGTLYNFTTYNFSALAGKETMFWCDGVGQARSYNDIDGVVIVDNSINLGADDKPINIVVHDNRLFLAYIGGLIQVSSLSDPFDWVSTSDELPIGVEITDLLIGVGNSLIIFCTETIKVLQGVGKDNWTLETFSIDSGAYPFTAYRLLGTMYYMDDRGVTSLSAVQEFGDYAANSIDKKVHNTIQENKDKVTSSAVSRERNEYRIFFSNGYGVFFSFTNKSLKGATLVQYKTPVIFTTEGEDAEGNSLNFFSSTDGYVYQMDSGTSFNGEAIEAIMETAYYHYNSPRNWKKFKRLTFEIDSRDEVDFLIKMKFDYNLPDYTSSIEYIKTTVPTGGRWGDDNWNEFSWSGGDIDRQPLYVNGMGTNMGVTIYSKEAYKDPHTIQNFITDFTLVGRQV